MRLRHVLLAATLLGSALPTLACRMTMALEQWPPYLYRDAQGSYTGLDLELLRAIFKEAHCTLVTLPELPTARRQLLFQLDTVESGGFELMFGDCGHIYFYITKEDLAARRFDRIWLILQCY